MQTLAEMLAKSLDDDEVSEMDILDALINREKLGSTGLGHGVALPHGRIKGLRTPLAAIITLEEGVDFGSTDEQAVDLMTGLIVPENCEQEHLTILADLAKIFSQEKLRQAMRESDNPSEVLEIFLTKADADTINTESSAQRLQPDSTAKAHANQQPHDARTSQ